MHDTDTSLLSDLLIRIQRKKERLDGHRPLPESAVRKLREELRLLHTYHSNAIEGNTLTLQNYGVKMRLDLYVTKITPQHLILVLCVGYGFSTAKQ